MKFEPGIHDISTDAYHDLPALSASGAWTIVQDCVMKFWHDSPFNPDYKPERSRAFDIGTAAHLALLEPNHFAARAVIIDAPDYRTKAAQQQRDEAYNLGKTPLLVHQVEDVMAIRKSVLAHPIAAAAFTDGKPEQSVLWTDPATGLPCKARPDWIRNGRAYIVDLKTASSANPYTFPGNAYRLGYPLRAAWYIDGYERVTGERLNYWFVAVEKKPPYLVSVFHYDDQALEWGRLIARQALAIFARAIERDECPGYRKAPHLDKDRAFEIGLPTHAQYQLSERYEEGDFQETPPPQELLKRAMEMQAP